MVTCIGLAEWDWLPCRRRRGPCQKGVWLFDFPGSPCNVYNGFVAAGYVELRGSLPFFAYPVYLECVLGLGGRDNEIFNALGLHIKGHNRHFVIGGDFNVTPEEIMESK